MPRDYRNFELFDIKEIYDNNLETKEWLGKRLSFLWDLRNHYSKIYVTHKLSKEKEMFYDINDAEVLKIAREHHTLIQPDLPNNADIKYEFHRLSDLKEHNPQEFLLKKNMALYDHILNNYSSYSYLGSH